MCAGALTIARDFVAIGGALVAIFVGLWGLRSWQRQLAANTDLSVARPLLRSTYSVREAIRFIRSLVPLAEIEAATRSAREDAPEEAADIRRRWERPLYAKRWERMSSAIVDFDAAVLEAEALWGGGARDAARSLRTQAARLHTAIRRLSHYSELGTLSKEQEASREQAQRIVQSQGEEDEFGSAVEEAVGQIESFVRPKIRFVGR